MPLLDWQVSHASYELANGFLMRRMHLEPEEGFPTNAGKNPWMKLSPSPASVLMPALELVIIHG